MKVGIIKIGLLIVVVLTTGGSYCQDRGSVSVNISMLPDGTISKKDLLDSRKDVFLILTIQSKREEILQVPKGADWGVDTLEPSVFAIQAQKLVNGKYENQKSNSRFDYLPEEDVDTLHYNDSRVYKMPINLLYPYSRGAYRMRVLCRFGMLGVGKDTYSNWLYFNYVE